MGQACSCLQHRRKLERRASDESTLHGTDGDFESEASELDILIDGSSGGSSSGIGNSSSSGAGEIDELLGGRLRGGVFTKRNSKSARVDLDESEEYTSSTSVSITSMATLEAEDQLQSTSTSNTSSARLLGQKSGAAASLEKNLEVLRSYQKATGVVDEGENDLECVMCLDTFNPDNPKVRTLCNCGMNRTNFHMSCLMEWKNRNAKCPVCREYLFYED
ncbi:hypothetical protein Gpo141_00011555 [Globisporangium polare]